MSGTKTMRELLELAAKAAGIELVWYSHLRLYEASGVTDLEPALPHVGRAVWKPQHDDGDSRRLQVACLLDMQLHADAVVVLFWRNDEQVYGVSESFSDHDGDKNAATRMAVLKAAAAMGEAMP